MFRRLGLRQQTSLGQIRHDSNARTDNKADVDDRYDNQHDDEDVEAILLVTATHSTSC